MTDSIHLGGCLCGAVRYAVNGPMGDVIYCHCEQCRRTSGHFVAATACARDDMIVQEDRGLQWFSLSDRARRGFCGLCGSAIFWDSEDRETISVMAGTLDVPTRLTATGHIFVESASDYYDLNDGLPQSLRHRQGNKPDTDNEHQ